MQDCPRQRIEFQKKKRKTRKTLRRWSLFLTSYRWMNVEDHHYKRRPVFFHTLAHCIMRMNVPHVCVCSLIRLASLSDGHPFICCVTFCLLLKFVRLFDRLMFGCQCKLIMWCVFGKFFVFVPRYMDFHLWNVDTFLIRDSVRDGRRR